MAEAPEAFAGGREGLTRHAGERRQVVLDREVDGDALGAAARAAGEQTRLVEACTAAEALKSENASLRGHGGVV
jgi:hypothetical protein